MWAKDMEVALGEAAKGVGGMAIERLWFGMVRMGKVWEEGRLSSMLSGGGRDIRNEGVDVYMDLELERIAK